MKKQVSDTKTEVVAVKNETKLEKGRQFDGKIISTAMKNTVIVVVERFVTHPIYKKAVRRTKHLAAHVVSGDYKKGDKVTIRETRPVSKTKHFVVVGKAN